MGCLYLIDGRECDAYIAFTMLRRSLEIILQPPAPGDPMLFLSGPRQVGKTHLVKEQFPGAYYNWDTIETRRAFAKDPYFFRTGEPVILFDEIHKRRDWKKLLKGYYDSPGRRENFIVIGSRRLDVFQRGGDSLQGRYSHWHLWPIALDELYIKARSRAAAPRDFATFAPDQKADDAQLRRLGGFPQPFLSGSELRLRRWLDEYLDRLVRQDVRDLSSVTLLDQMDLFARILPSRTGSPISMRSLAEDCEVSPVAIKAWLNLFEILYFGFRLRPYARRIERAVKKEPKWYFYQWVYNESPGSRFENYLAVQLAAACSLWSEQGYGRYELFYVRDQNHREVDFLISRDLKPLALIEAKASAQDWPASLSYYCKKLKIPGFLVYPEGPVKRLESGWSLPSARFLRGMTLEP